MTNQNWQSTISKGCKPGQCCIEICKKAYATALI